MDVKQTVTVFVSSQNKREKSNGFKRNNAYYHSHDDCDDNLLQQELMMIGYCISDTYCQYKSDTGYCGYTGGCVKEIYATIKVPPEQRWHISQTVDISTDSIEAIADAVVKKLRGKQDG